MTTLLDAHIQWVNRPPDERYLNLEDLLAGVQARKDRSDEFNHVEVGGLWANVIEEGPQAGELYCAKLPDGSPLLFTHWSFSQYTTLVGGPDVRWLREMPAEISAQALNDSIQHRGRVAHPSGDYPGSLAKLYVASGAEGEPGWMRALTSPTYGRIYDEQLVRAVIRLNHDGRWVVPGKVAGNGWADMYAEVTKQSTTLYASDRDCFIFLVDEEHPVEVDGERYFRGLITSNSEVGKATLTLKSFLCVGVCCNRIIHKATNIKQLDIRHTSQGPIKFLEEAEPALETYSNADTSSERALITAAKATSVGSDKEEAQRWLRDRGFSKQESITLPMLAEQATDIGSSGDPTSLWDLVAAGTAYAREIEHADSRVDFEEKVGNLLDRYVTQR